MIQRYPQWWIAGGVVAAWAGLAATTLGHALGPVHHHGFDPVHWTLMCVAMAVPPNLPAVRHVYANSIRVRRQWASGVYLAAYLAVWLGLGGIAYLVGLVTADVPERTVAVAGLGVAAAWQVTRAKRRAVLACARTVPLPPAGRRADAACVRFGLRQGRRCVVSCWPLMLLMGIVAVPLAAMAAAAVLMYAEERTTAGRRLVGSAVVLFSAAATAIAVFG
ncbi:copper chaperone [Hamadaea tsunoensis]|uniref:copper chaperone n=1 Tax=Hamadaea tsunoensis TaxID=53368 RepID=UPI0003F9183E|nr:DUF2182 domain-containing protein [Hamadaea tsunoensis]